MALNELAARDVGPADAPNSTASSNVGIARQHRIRLWDLPLRLFHWGLLVAITVAIVTGKLGGEWMPLHGRAGIAIVGLIAFRLTWGLIGSETSRFAYFLPSPKAITQYVQGKWRGLGHNPLGALSVVALLGVIGVQVGTGLFSNDDIAFAGPLAALASEDTVLGLTGWHRQLPNALFVLLGLHIMAVVFHVLVKKDDIVKPMITGWKRVPSDLPAPRRARRIALVLALAAGLGGAYAASGLWIGRQESAPPAVSQSSASPTSATGTAPAATNGSTAGATPGW
jgi:cytochrome b